MDDGTVRLLGQSIISNDRIILLAAIAALVCFIVPLVLKWVIINELKDKKRSDKTALKRHAVVASKAYTIFLTIISIFPLLGMLGTVNGLLGLDLASGDMENIKNNFFIALTSTAWGIIFSIIFKILDAIFLENIENVVDPVKKL